MGEQTLFHAGQEHEWEFQALGGVQCHQLNTVFMVFGLRFTGIQSRLGNEFRQRVHAILHFVIRQGIHQFLKVLHPGLAFLTFFAGVIVLQAAVFDGLLHQAM